MNEIVGSLSMPGMACHTILR